MQSGLFEAKAYFQNFLPLACSDLPFKQSIGSQSRCWCYARESLQHSWNTLELQLHPACELFTAKDSVFANSIFSILPLI